MAYPEHSLKNRESGDSIHNVPPMPKGSVSNRWCPNSSKLLEFFMILETTR